MYSTAPADWATEGLSKDIPLLAKPSNVLKLLAQMHHYFVRAFSLVSLSHLTNLFSHSLCRSSNGLSSSLFDTIQQWHGSTCS